MGTLPMPFSNPYDYGGRHTGVDFAQARGTLILASGPGRMSGHSRSASGGWIGWVEFAGYRWGIGYAHQDGFGMMPPVNAGLAFGDIIGAVGNSGRSTGPHVHVENSGDPTPRGFYSVFDRNHYIGDGTPAGGGGNVVPFPPTPPTRDPRLDQILMSMPAVLAVQNPGGGGMNGAYVLLDRDRGYIYPDAHAINEAKVVSAPFFNNGVATVGTQLLGLDGRPVANGGVIVVSEQTLNILMRDLGYPSGAAQKVWSNSGGEFVRGGDGGGTTEPLPTPGDCVTKAEVEEIVSNLVLVTRK